MKGRPQEIPAMETIPQAKKSTIEATSEPVITSPLIPDLVIRPVPTEVLERLREEIPVLRAHRAAMLARRGGQLFTNDELVGALHEARAAHERGE
jgi:hypothetical protein